MIVKSEIYSQIVELLSILKAFMFLFIVVSFT